MGRAHTFSREVILDESSMDVERPFVTISSDVVLMKGIVSCMDVLICSPDPLLVGFSRTDTLSTTGEVDIL